MMLQGSNSLRGGKKKYGPKTKCGNWVELNKEPGQSLPSGFPHAMYRTDAHQQMIEGVLQRPKRFGAGLPPPEDTRIDYSRAINYDKQQGDSGWAAITTTEFVAPGDGSEKSKEFASSFKLTGGMTDPEKLREYRENWTVEKDCVRPVRFKTDAVTSSNTGVPARFRMTETRKLPGTPKAVDRFRAKVLENGQMGVVKLRQALQQRIFDATCASADSAGTGIVDGFCQRLVQANDLVEGLKGAGMSPLSVVDAHKVIEHFATAEGGGRCSSGGAGGNTTCGTTVAEIFGGLQFGGSMMNEGRRQAVTTAFRKLDEGGSGVVGAAKLRERYEDTATAGTGAGASLRFLTQEARKTLLDSFSLYQDSSGDGMTSAGFEGFMEDVSSGVDSDADFAAVLDALVEK